MHISRKLISAVKLADRPAYKLAQEAGLDPNLLSKLIRGIVQPKPEDERIVRVGELLGLEPSECFDESEQGQI